MLRAALLSLALALAPGAAAMEPNRPVAQVDLARYVGTWYEQAHLPNRFQRDCARDTSATYTLRRDGRIDVLNRCTREDGVEKSSRGIARRVGGSTSQLEVRFAPAWLSFLPVVWGDYWIVGLDPDYRWALVGSPDRDYLWVLARERRIADEEYAAVVARARAMGYPVDRLRRTPQR